MQYCQWANICFSTLHIFSITAANFVNPIKITYPPDDDNVKATLDNHPPIFTEVPSHLYPPYLLATQLHPLCLLTTSFQHYNIIIALQSTLDRLNYLIEVKLDVGIKFIS